MKSNYSYSDRLPCDCVGNESSSAFEYTEANYGHDVFSNAGRWSREHERYEHLQTWPSKSAGLQSTGRELSKPKPVEKSVDGRGGLLHLLAGGLAGCASTLVTCPIDVIKTRQQASGQIASSTARNVRRPDYARALVSTLRAHYTAATQPSIVYPSSMLQHSRYIVRVEGLRSFYKGLGPSLLGVVPSRALFFFAYDSAKRTLQRNFYSFRTNTLKTHIAASSFGGFICTTATCPLWVLKTKQQLHRRKNKVSLSAIECVRRIWHSEGIKGFYRGLTASYAGIIETVLYFTIYDQLKAMYVRKHQMEPFSAIVSMSTFWELPGLMVISSLAKCSATCIAYPHEVIRTRLREEPVKQKYSGFFQTLKRVYIKEGIRGLYGGLPAQLVRQVPNMAILMGVYEGVVFFARY